MLNIHIRSIVWFRCFGKQYKSAGENREHTIIEDQGGPNEHNYTAMKAPHLLDRTFCTTFVMLATKEGCLNYWKLF